MEGLGRGRGRHRLGGAEGGTGLRVERLGQRAGLRAGLGSELAGDRLRAGVKGLAPATQCSKRHQYLPAPAAAIRARFKITTIETDHLRRLQVPAAAQTPSMARAAQTATATAVLAAWAVPAAGARRAGLCPVAGAADCRRRLCGGGHAPIPLTQVDMPLTHSCVRMPFLRYCLVQKVLMGTSPASEIAWHPAGPVRRPTPKSNNLQRWYRQTAAVAAAAATCQLRRRR